MKARPAAAFLLMPLALSGCMTGQAVRTGNSQTPVMLDIRKTAKPNGLACEVEVFATYANDMADQTRELVISDTSSQFVRSLATIQLPRPADDPRPVDNADGTSSFRMFQWSFGRCREVPLKIEIGECETGACSEMRVSKAVPDGVTVEVTRNGAPG